MKYFQTVANAVYGVSKLDALVYYLFVNLNLKEQGDKDKEIVKIIANFLISNYFIKSQVDISMNLNSESKFEDVNEGIKWMVATRLAREYVLKRMKDVNEKTTSQALQISST